MAIPRKLKLISHRLPIYCVLKLPLRPVPDGNWLQPLFFVSCPLSRFEGARQVTFFMNGV